MASPTIGAMHLLIPYASVSSPDCRAQFPLLQLPRLAELLARLAPEATDSGDDHALSPPHERALAHALGLPAADDGRIAWAAYFSLAGSASPALLGQAPGENRRGEPVACAWFIPCHWNVGMEQVMLLAPDELSLAEADSRALMAALSPLAAEDGITLVYETPLRWRAEGDMFTDLACASLDRVIGRSLTDWLPDGPGARDLRRLQSEAQMLFYTHPVTDARDARRLTPVNSFWISGAGTLNALPQTPQPLPEVPLNLRAPALQAAWDQWALAWEALDAGPVTAALKRLDAGHAVTLTLCGERHARRWSGPAHTAGFAGWAARARQWLRGPEPAWKTLETL